MTGWVGWWVVWGYCSVVVTGAAATGYCMVGRLQATAGAWKVST